MSFDPDPNAPHSFCTKCDGKPTFQTEELTREHMHANRGHPMRITNPNRSDRIERVVDNEINDALNDAFDNLYEYVERGGLTVDELTTAIRMSSVDVCNEWEQYLEGMDE